MTVSVKHSRSSLLLRNNASEIGIIALQLFNRKCSAKSLKQHGQDQN